MTTPRRVSFLNAFKTANEAADFLKEIVDPGVVIHLYCRDHETDIHSELFAVCTQSGFDFIQEELDASDLKENK